MHYRMPAGGSPSRKNSAKVERLDPRGSVPRRVEVNSLHLSAGSLPFRLTVLFVCWLAVTPWVLGQTKPAVVPNIEMQPLAAQVRRLIEAMDYLGEPFRPVDLA